MDSLTDEDLILRASAEMALRSKYCSVMLMWERTEKRCCTISLEWFTMNAGLECSGLNDRHFIATESLEPYVRYEVSAELGRRRQLEGKITCPVPGCAAVFTDADLAKKLSCDPRRRKILIFLKY